MKMTPKARESHVLVHEVDDEVVLYDQERKRAHRLNPSAKRVWGLLDGERDVGAIAAELGVEESVVEFAIDDLANARLLAAGEPLSMTRRSALRRAAAAAAIGFVLPAVTSIAAPLASQAQSSGYEEEEGEEDWEEEDGKRKAKGKDG